MLGVGRVGALPPWLRRVRRSACLGGVLGSRCLASHRVQHSVMCRVRALRVTEPSRTGGSLSAESTVLSATPWNPLSQALIYSLTVYPPSTAPAAPLPLLLLLPLYLSHCPLYLSDHPHPRTLSSSLHTPPALSPPL